jgi:hypothetical protein
MQDVRSLWLRTGGTCLQPPGCRDYTNLIATWSQEAPDDRLSNSVSIYDFTPVAGVYYDRLIF